MTKNRSRRALAFVTCLGFVCAITVVASYKNAVAQNSAPQDIISETLQNFSNTASEEGSENIVLQADPTTEIPPLEPEVVDLIDMPLVKLRSLDKTTARTMTFQTDVGSTLKFGPIFIKVQSCRKSSPVEEPESAAFLQVWENAQDGAPEWIFSGWMFASSPGLSAMDHPIYDVWVLDCLPHPDNTSQDSAASKPQNKDDQVEVNSEADVADE